MPTDPMESSLSASGSPIKRGVGLLGASQLRQLVQKWASSFALRRDDRGVGRGDLSDEQWAVLEPFLPVVVLGRPSLGRRRLLDGIRWRVRTGAPWRDLPSRCGPRQTVYGLLRRWQRDGTWPELLTRLQARADAAGLITWEVGP